MALPHLVQMRLIKKRLIEKEGKQKLNEIKQIISELPGYNTGPYGEIKKFLKTEIEKTKTKSKIKHQDWLGVKKQGIKQFCLVGCPSVGKSSLIKKLSGIQIKIAAYEFTTLKPQPAIININHAKFQIIDFPGLIKGAIDDIGGGKRLLGIIRESDGIILMHDLTKNIEETKKIIDELKKANIVKPTVILGNKEDISNKEHIDILKKEFPKNKVITTSTTNGTGLANLQKELWNLSKLIRIFPKHQENPVILEKNATIRDFTEKIHRDLLKQFRFSRVTGTSTKFPNQQVGLNHKLEDNDIVELVIKR